MKPIWPPSPDGIGKNPFLDDLSAWVGKEALVRLILEVVSEIDRNRPEFRDRVRTNTELRPQMMLTLLTYCYAIGVFASDEIEAAATHDRMVRYLCARMNPSAEQIRRFRRASRPLLKEALAKVFGLGWPFRWRTVEPFDADLELEHARFVDGETHFQMRVQFAGDAERRINQAVFTDSMALDD